MEISPASTNVSYGSSEETAPAPADAEPAVVWQKAHASGSHGPNCIELGSKSEFVGVRDSKNLEAIQFADAAVKGLVAYAAAVRPAEAA